MKGEQQERTRDVPSNVTAARAAMLANGEPNMAIALKRFALGADFHNDFGMALIAANKHAEAASEFERAVALVPDHAAALGNLGNALVALGRADEGIAHLQRAAVLDPSCAATAFNLAAALATGSRHGDAILHFHRALAAAPELVRAWSGLGASLYALNRVDEAAAAFRQALQLDADHAEAWHGLGLSLQVLGKLDDARDAFAQAVAIESSNLAYHRSLAEAKHYAAADRHLAALRSFDAKPESLSNGQRIELHFALGKACADIGEHAHAFRHWQKGNALKRAQTDYDEAATLELWRHIQHAFTKDVLARFSDAGEPSDAPIFVVGMPRSGTTLVEQILASHPAVYGAGELPYLADGARAFRGRGAGDYFPEIARTISVDGLRRFGMSYVQKLHALAPDAARITDKMPANFRFIGLIRMALPNARIIHVRRDPVDTCLSCFSKLFTGSQPHSYDLAELGRYYVAYETLMAHWRGVLPKGAMLEVRYEDIVGDFENQTRRLVAYAGLDWDDRCLAFHQTVRPVRTASLTQVRRSLYREAVGRSTPYRAMLGPLLDALKNHKQERGASATAGNIGRDARVMGESDA